MGYLFSLGACGTSDFSRSWQGVPSIRSCEGVLWKFAYALKQVQTSLNMLGNSPIVCSLFVISLAQSMSRSFFDRLAMQGGQSWQCMLPELCFNGGPFLTWSLWHLGLLRVLTGCAINQVLRGPGVLWKLAYALKQVQTSLNMLVNCPIVCSLFIISRAQSLSRSFIERLAMQGGQSWQCMLPELCFNGGPFLTWSLWYLGLLRVLTGCAINQVLRGCALKTCLCFETSPDKSQYAWKLSNSLLPLCLQPSSKFE
jgi:hypothetical protein